MKNKSKISKTPKLNKSKRYKVPGFQFYFVIVVTIVVMTTIAISSTLSNWLSNIIPFDEKSNTFLVLLGLGLIIGWLLSLIVSKILLKPINKLQSEMKKVAEGDLKVRIKETSRIKEIDNMNHSFNLMVKELGSNYEMQKDFISNVSHEFKTPLATIEGYAMLLQDSSITEEEKLDNIKEILSTISLMSDLVSNILLLSKIENQSIEFTKESFLLDEQIRKVVVMLEQNWVQKNIQLDVDLDEVRIYTNQSLMLHVWRNLIENAIKFTPENSKVTIVLKQDAKNIEFSISDEGKGIKEEEKEAIFNKFFQSDSSRKQEGNGLGLALVKKIMDVVGGSVSQENLEPKGCKFTIKLKK